MATTQFFITAPGGKEESRKVQQRRTTNVSKETLRWLDTPCAEEVNWPTHVEREERKVVLQEKEAYKGGTRGDAKKIGTGWYPLPIPKRERQGGVRVVKERGQSQ